MIDLLQGKRKEKKEKKFWPLKDISFQGYQGEILGIVGANGSGKTTLCKVLTGILAPDKGNLSVDGKVTALFSHGIGRNATLTGRENDYSIGLMLGIKKEKMDQFIDERHAFVGLVDF